MELARIAPDAVFLGRDRADLSQPDTCAALIRQHRPAAVINVAAWTAVDKAENHEAEARIVNAEAPKAMARACAETGTPLVHISTDYVFDGSGETPWTPHDIPAPINAYGRSKLAGEGFVQAAGGAHVILRTSWVFSAHGANFVKTMLRLGAERAELTVVSDQIGGPTAAADIAKAALTAAQCLVTSPDLTGIYHYSGTPEISWAGFARAIMAAANLPCRITDIPSSAYPTPARRPLNSRLNCDGLGALGLTRPDWRASLHTVLEELEATP